ncbi:hypothetical protein BC332_19789 [Capsicum chinense]|nr:hypothetical protein BC332_19789 [Capsicum chinense]
MDETATRHRTGGKVSGGSNGEKGGGSSNGDFEPSIGRFTDHIIIDVLEKMDLKSICTAACVSPTFNFVFAYRLPFVSTSDLSVPRAKSLTIECLQMRNDSSIINILGEHIEDLSLLKCSHLSYDILRAIGERGKFHSKAIKNYLKKMYKRDDAMNLKNHQKYQDIFSPASTDKSAL